MNISVQQLLMKMETELAGAKASDSVSRLRERVYAIRSLCELVLEEDVSLTEVPKSITANSLTPIPMQQTNTVPMNLKKLDEKEANGDSLFDF